MKKFIVMLIMLIITFTVFSVNAQSEEVIMELFCNDTICEDGRFYGGNLTLSSKIKKQLSNGEAIAIIAQYADDGTLLDVALSKNIIEQPDDEITVSLSSVEETGIVKCMVFDAQTLEPVSPAQVYASYADNVTIWADMLEDKMSTTSTTKRSAIEYYASYEAVNTVKLYIEKNPIIIVNGIQTTKFANSNLFKAFENDVVKIQFIENTGDAFYDVIDVTIYEHLIVSEVIADRNRIVFQDGQVVTFDFDDLLKTIEFYDKDGNVSSFDKISNGDVLAMVVGELNDRGYPIMARSFTENITVYNLKSSYVAGKFVGFDYNEGMMYINDIPYRFSDYFVSESVFSDVFKCFGNNILEPKLGIEGDFYLSINNIIIGYKGNADTSNYAFILQGAESASTWDKCYQIKVLLADGSIKTYDIDDEVVVCEGSDERELVFAAGDHDAYFKVAEWTRGTNDAYKRVIDFKTDSKGKIIQITYLYLNSHDDNDYSKLSGGSKYQANISSIDGKYLSDNTIIFNADVYDSDYASVLYSDNLIDGGKYQGYVLKEAKGKYNVFVITSGSNQLSQKKPLKIVDKAIYYLHNDEHVLKVFYYTEGSNELKSVMFSADSERFASSSLRYSSLSKGSIFACETTDDNIVKSYMILANVKNDQTYYDMNGFSERFVAMYDDEDAECVFGPIQKITYNNENVIITVNGSDYIIDGATYQYHYNSEGSKTVINIGDIIGKNVDDADDRANYVYLYIYDGRVKEAISFSQRAEYY